VTRAEILEAACDVARQRGLAEFTLRDLAERVGMRAPSLYSHFVSKHAIYDAMFGQAWSDFEQVAFAELAKPPADSTSRDPPNGACFLRLRSRQPGAPSAHKPASHAADGGQQKRWSMGYRRNGPSATAPM
jgi:AcrR family transcriptional regulator